MREAIISVLTVAVLGWVGTNLVFSARTSFRRRSHAIELVRGVRLRHVGPAPLVLLAVLGAFGVLWLLPPLRIGWWTLLGGEGNVVFGTTGQTRGTAWEVVIPIVFVLLLLPALPILVEAEERRFRLGAEEWTTAQRVSRALHFGLIHLVVGIPVAAALALSIGGGWFTLVYLRAYRRTASRVEAMAESTRAHLAYDLVVIGLVAMSFALTACGGTEPSGLRVSSPDLREGGRLPERFSCTGDNVAPTLTWTGPPPGTRGWAVVVEDPDAATGTFTHWVVTGLGAAARTVGDDLPAGAVEGLTSSGQPAYVGPCPPTGEEHRFRYRVHALRELLILEPTTSVTEARRRIEALSLDAAEIEVTYRTP